MPAAAPTLDDPWLPLAPDAVRDLFGATSARWWLSGGAALDRWLGAPVRERANVDISTTGADLPALIETLPSRYSAWVCAGDDPVAWADAPEDIDPHPVQVRDDASGAWVLRANVEDGTAAAWLYRRDPRLQLPWERAVLDLDGIPTGAPEIQLVWKALRPRPEDDADKDAVLATLSPDAVQFYETALLRVHPHSTWAIHVRSPFAPAKPSWNRPAR